LHEKKFLLPWRLALSVAALLLVFNFRAEASLATAWHIPDNTGDLGFNMRNPEFAVGTSTAVTFYTGVWKFNGAVQLCNQTGGTLYYKLPPKPPGAAPTSRFIPITARATNTGRPR